MKEYYRKKRLLSCLTSLIVFGIVICLNLCFEDPMLYVFIVIFVICLPMAARASLKWATLYWKINPTKYYGVVPAYTQGRPDMNIWALNTYKWILTAVVSGAVSVYWTVYG